MVNRRRPILTALRVDARERAMIDAVAEYEGRSISELLREIVLPAMQNRVTDHIAKIRSEQQHEIPECRI